MAETKEEKEEIEDKKKEQSTMDKTAEEKAAEKTESLSELVSEFVSELPEDMQALISASLSDVEKIKLARGLIKTSTQKENTTQDGPGSQTPGKKQTPDYNTMSSSELLEAGLK
ncbi:hypothetical protein [Desulfobacula sp.]|uniref:hypothetical protein n=1 Tax=Desulfobacula sp. TaxID=2593537 RepID=UPI00262FD28E|nr:hypothetical protein [Desulfobacula sp.]